MLKTVGTASVVAVTLITALLSRLHMQSDQQIWGAYIGSTAASISAFEQQVGKPTSARAVFVHWGNENEFPLELKRTMRNKVLVIFWEAMDYNNSTVKQPAFSYQSILRGEWDTYLTSFAKDAKTYRYPVILVPFEEMNGNWYPWSGTTNGNTPRAHIAAYRYVHSFFKDAPNVQFGWSVNSNSVPDTYENRIAAYYPGDAYVDYVGVNGFNFGEPWQSFEQIFGAAFDQLRTYKKPLFIFSMASADGPLKATWIRDAMRQIAREPDLAGWIWFNEDKEQDWRIWSDEKSLKAFTDGLQGLR